MRDALDNPNAMAKRLKAVHAGRIETGRVASRVMDAVCTTATGAGRIGGSSMTGPRQPSRTVARHATSMQRIYALAPLDTDTR